MIATPNEILRAFEQLSSEEQEQVTTAILQRAPRLAEARPATDGPVNEPISDYGDLRADALDEMAGELFRAYDKEESAHAQA
jgi:hypothetical protein